MKGLRTILGITLATAGFGGALVVGATSSNILNKNTQTQIANASVVTTETLYRFTAPADWANVYLHAWGSETADKNTTWGSFIKLTQYSYNENSQKVFIYPSTVDDYTGFIMIRYDDNPDYCKSANINVGTDRAWYWVGHNQDVGSWSPDAQTYYFYDYENAYQGDVKVWAWMSNGTYNNVSSYSDSPTMTRVSNSSYVYSIELDPMFDVVKIHNSSDTISNQEYVNQHRNGALTRWNSSSQEWRNYDYAMAHDWVNNTMHLRDISTDNNSDTNACRASGSGSASYYSKAVTAYNSFSNEIKTIIANESNYSYAYARLQAWATACGSSVSIAENGGKYSLVQGARSINGLIIDSSKYPMVIAAIILAVISVVSVGGYFFLRKKKEQ